MKSSRVMYFAVLIAVFMLSGCVVRSYPLTKDRVDQDLTAGNRGYLIGQSSGAAQAKERKAARTVQVVEVEIGSPIRFEKSKKKVYQESGAYKAEEAPIAGNRGYIMQSESTGINAPAASEKYTVQKNDTLQKISKKFYGTTKKWTKIYDANKDVLKGPNKVYPGQVLNIPVEALKETKENLK